jgi:hypothetical protein
MQQILVWADRHRCRTGQWPSAHSGAVAGAAGQTWGAINQALSGGRRGLPGGDSLAQVLHRLRQVPERRGRQARPGRWRRAAALRAQGLTLAEVGRRLGVSHQRVSQMLRLAAAECRSRPGQRTSASA